MAAPYYAGDALLLYNNLMDTKGLDPNSPTKDIDAEKVLAIYTKIISERYTKAEMDLAKRDIAVMNNSLAMLKSVNDTRAKLAETKGRDRRAVVEALTSRRNSIEKQRAYITGKMNASADMRAVEGAKAQGGAATGNLEAGKEFINIRDAKGARVDQEHPAINAYAARFVQLTGNKGESLDSINPAEFARRIFPNDEPSASQLQSMLEGGKRTAASLSDAQVQLSNDLAELGNGLGIASDEGKWNSLSEDQKQKLVQDEILRNDSAKSTLERILGRSEEDILVEKQKLVSEDEEYQRLLDDRAAAERRMLGSQGATTRQRMAEIVASPTFRAWAESNGYSLGVSETVDGKLQYIPSPDDMQAVLAYRWQLNHPKRTSPFSFGRGSTGARVRVTVDDPAKREAIMQQYAVNGKLYVDDRGALVSPEYLALAARSNGLVPQLQTAVVNKTTYIRMPDGSIVGADGQPAQLPDGAVPVFANAVVYSSDAPDAKPVRYLTPADIGTPNLGALVGTVGDAERADFDATLTKTSPFKEASPEAIRAQTVTVVNGRLDKMHAADSATADGIGVVSLDGGRIRIPESAQTTIEVLEAPDRTTLRDVWRAWRGRLSEHDAALADQAEREGASVDERMSAAERARREAAGDFGGKAAPPAAGTAATGGMVSVQTTDSFGSKKEVLVPAGSAAAGAAPAAPAPAAPAAPAPAAPAPAKAAPPAAPAAPAPAPTTAPAAPAAEKQYIRTSRGVYEVNADDSLTQMLDADNKPVSKKLTPGTADYKAALESIKAGSADVDVKLADGKVASVVDKTTGAALPVAGTAGEITRAELAREPEIGRRLAAAVIDYGAREKGLLGKAKEFVEGVGRGRGGAEGGAGAEGRRGGEGGAPAAAPGETPEVPAGTAKPTLLDRFRARRDAARAEKARAGAEAGRLELPVAAELPEAPDGGTVARKLDTERMPFAATSPLSSDTDIGSAKPRFQGPTQIGEAGMPEVLSPGMTPEALKRAADAELLGKIRQTRGGSRDFDLAMRAEALEQKRVEAEKARDLARRGGGEAAPFDADAYAKEARAIADEARRRMKPPGAEFLTLGYTPEGKGEGLGVDTMEETTAEAAAAKEAAEEAERKARAAAPGKPPAAVAPQVPGGPRAPKPAAAVPPAAAPQPETAEPAPVAPPEERPAPVMSPEMVAQVRDFPSYAQSEERRKAREAEERRNAAEAQRVQREAEAARRAEAPPMGMRGVAERQRSVALPAGVIAPPPARSLPPAVKPEARPAGATEDLGLTETFRTTNPAAVQQFIRNVDEQNRKPTLLDRLMGRRKQALPAPAAPAEAPPKP